MHQHILPDTLFPSCYCFPSCSHMLHLSSFQTCDLCDSIWNNGSWLQDPEIFAAVDLVPVMGTGKYHFGSLVWLNRILQNIATKIDCILSIYIYIYVFFVLPEFSQVGCKFQFQPTNSTSDQNHVTCLRRSEYDLTDGAKSKPPTS